jgi:hypothetical protein
VRHALNSVAASVALATLFLATTTGFAQGGASLYSRLGLGDLRPGSDTRSAGMGYTGIASASSTTVNPFAPATWSKIDRARLEGGMLYEGFNSTDGTTTRYLSRGNFNGVTFAIPVSSSNGIVAVLGFTPFSKVDYTAYSLEQYIAGTDTMNSTITYTGKGGLSKGLIGTSFSPLSNLSLGFSLNYLFGTIDHLTNVAPDGAQYSEGTVTQSLSLHGLTFSFGGLYEEIGAGALQPLSLGFVITTGTTLTATDQKFYQYVDQADTSGERAGTATIPMTFGVGASYRVGERWICSADFTTQPWSNATIDGTPTTYLRNSANFGFGLERQATKDLPGAPFLDRLAYRLGAYYHSTYITFSNEGINAWGITAGLGIPVTNEARLQLAIEYGQRGTTSNSLIQDSILRLTISLGLSELWFSRNEED